MRASLPEGIDELLVTVTDEKWHVVEAKITVRINDVAAEALDQRGVRFRGTRASGSLAIDIALPATATSRIEHVVVGAIDSSATCEMCER